VTLRAPWVMLRTCWVTLRARWVMLRAGWVTLRARWVTLRARWVTLRARWVTLRARWVMLRACWVTLRARWVTLRNLLGAPPTEEDDDAAGMYIAAPIHSPGASHQLLSIRSGVVSTRHFFLKGKVLHRRLVSSPLLHVCPRGHQPLSWPPHRRSVPSPPDCKTEPWVKRRDAGVSGVLGLVAVDSYQFNKKGKEASWKLGPADVQTLTDVGELPG
jgi:hypothetical protein